MDVTITFDNGPDEEETPYVLDILRRHQVASTFFLQCNKLRSATARKTAERTRAEGHWIGNHTLNHKTPLGLTTDPDAPKVEIGEAQLLLGDLAHPRKLFRPNGKGRVGRHLLSRSAVAYLQAGGFTCVLWSIMPRDGTDPEGWVDRAMQHCAAVPWASVVVHDRAGGGMRYLEDFILRVKDSGGRFRQDFAADVTPIADGRVVGDIDAIANDDPAAQRRAWA